MRRHVKRVRRIGRQIRVHIGRVQPDDGARWVVEGVHDVVRGAGMAAVAAKHPQRDCAGLEVDARALPAALRRPHQRQRIKRRRVVVIRKSLRQLAHGFGVFDRALMTIALAVQHFYGVEVAALPLGGRFRQAFRPARGKLDERLAGTGHVLLRRIVVPAGMTQRLAPVRKRETGVRLLRLAKCFSRVLPFEAVKEFHPFEEIGLRGGAA